MFFSRCLSCHKSFEIDLTPDDGVDSSSLLGMTFLEECPLCGDVDEHPVVSYVPGVV